MTPSTEQLLALHTYLDQPVPESHLDQNGHMNITHYFQEGAWAAWQLLSQVTGTDYIEQRGLSFFTVEHHLRYLGELRGGQHYSVHAGMVERAGKALHGVAYVVDREREALACSMELVYVHVDMAERRSAPVPDDVAAGLDDLVGRHPWLPEAATALTLRR